MQREREVPKFKMGDRVKVDFKYLMIIRGDALKTKRIARVWDVRYYAAINAVSYVVKLRNGNIFEVFSRGVTVAPEKKKKAKQKD